MSGLIDEVFETCEEVGLAPHTISYCLGVWGKQELLPKMELLEITSMCGHAMTSANLVNRAIEEIRAGRKTPGGGGRRDGPALRLRLLQHLKSRRTAQAGGGAVAREYAIKGAIRYYYAFYAFRENNGEEMERG